MNLRSFDGGLSAAGPAALVFVAALAGVGCQSPQASSAAAVRTESVYSKETGRLEELRADVDADGKTETVAYMDGTTLKRIEIDRDGDGQPDRWEYYGPGVGPGGRGANPFDRWAVIVRAEEASRPGAPPTRRETYERGVIQRVEEDSNLDGRMDKWEFYEKGELTKVELDLQGKGFADRRLVYLSGGDVERIERDPDGDGKFEPMPPATH